MTTGEWDSLCMTWICRIYVRCLKKKSAKKILCQDGGLVGG